MNDLVKLISESNGTIFCSGAVSTLSDDVFNALEADAFKRESGRSRICLHHSTADSIQLSVIAFTQRAFFRPERHRPGYIECYQIIHGRMRIYLWNEDGVLKEIINMSPWGEGEVNTYYLSEPLWHTVVASSNVVTFLEVRPGPFVKDLDAEFAPWSPPSNTIELEKFINALPKATG